MHARQSRGSGARGGEDRRPTFRPRPTLHGWKARIALLAVVLLPACATLETLRAASLYRDGTRELVDGNETRAVQRLERARELAPEVSAIHNHLGLAYAAARRNAAALEAFERAVALDCDNAAAQRNLEAARRGRWSQLVSQDVE